MGKRILYSLKQFDRRIDRQTTDRQTEGQIMLRNTVGLNKKVRLDYNKSLSCSIGALTLFYYNCLQQIVLIS